MKSVLVLSKNKPWLETVTGNYWSLFSLHRSEVSRGPNHTAVIEILFLSLGQRAFATSVTKAIFRVDLWGQRDGTSGTGA